MLGLVKYAQACQTSKITKWQYLGEALSYFVYLLHVAAHSWKPLCYHAVLVVYGPACQKSSEITNHQNLWKVLSDFVSFLHVVIYILLDIHWIYKNMLFRVGIVGHRLSANQIFRCFKRKKLENYLRYHIEFLLPLKLQKISRYFGLRPQNTLGWSFCRIFYFWLV